MSKNKTYFRKGYCSNISKEPEPKPNNIEKQTVVNNLKIDNLKINNDVKDIKDIAKIKTNSIDEDIFNITLKTNKINPINNKNKNNIKIIL